MTKHASRPSSGPASGSSSGSLLSGFVVGAALGTLAGMAVAPSQKQRLRRWVKQSVQRSATQVPDWMDQASRVAQTQGDRLLGAAQQRWGGTLERLRDAVAAGVAASRSGVVSAELDAELDAESDAAQVTTVAPEAQVAARSQPLPARPHHPSHAPQGAEIPHADGRGHVPSPSQRRRNAYGRLQSAATVPNPSPPARGTQP